MSCTEPIIPLFSCDVESGSHCVCCSAGAQNRSPISAVLTCRKPKLIKLKQQTQIPYRMDWKNDVSLPGFSKLDLGLVRTCDQVKPKHPLERQAPGSTQQAEMEQLRKMNGLHAPLRFQMEKACVSKAGHFPFMSQRNRLHLDVLEGSDVLIDFTDVYGRPDNCLYGVKPHEAMEFAMAKNQLAASGALAPPQ